MCDPRDPAWKTDRVKINVPKRQRETWQVMLKREVSKKARNGVWEQLQSACVYFFHHLNEHLPLTAGCRSHSFLETGQSEFWKKICLSVDHPAQSRPSHLQGSLLEALAAHPR